MAGWIKENIRQTSGSSGGVASTVAIQDDTAGGHATVLATRAANPAANDNPLLVRAILGDELAIADLLVLASTHYVPTDINPGARNLLLTGSVLLGPKDGTNDAVRMASVLDGSDANPQANDNGLLTRAILGDEEAIADLHQFANDEYLPDDITPGARNLLYSLSMLYGPAAGTNNALRPASVMDGIADVPQSTDNPLLVTPAGPVSGHDNAGGITSVADATAMDLANSNPDRRYVEIKNLESSGGETLYIQLGNDASSGAGFPIQPGESWWMEWPAINTERISAFHDKGSPMDVAVIEY